MLSIYEEIVATDKRSPTRSILYEGTCSVCGKKVTGRKCDLEGVKTCRHPNLKNTSVPYSQITDESLRIVFEGIVKRCHKTYCKEYRWYGDKGVKVCDEWLSNPYKFQEWVESRMLHADSESKMSIDRIDPSKGYSPENCRVVPISENARWKSTTIPITVNYQTLTGRQWSERIGKSPDYINKMRRNIGIEKTAEYISKFLNEESQGG
jgi:hypothetical protein